MQGGRGGRDEGGGDRDGSGWRAVGKWMGGGGRLVLLQLHGEPGRSRRNIGGDATGVVRAEADDREAGD